ncbi:ABC transporter ATP-binding protein [Mesorhizobium sp. VK22B]|uniref:ABC transporter ATP-binding protein n=1 Tax=Mesorhizobium captivum TaxID=3072319 RepID=A0ABU4Z7X4_9HYPH|nr:MULTISPECIES: ABC transporter ATP-binding protein [unclassified Mesorhizobium]MDX8495300.1 ABC transporter ATP-binding protein [Mesorhizobium sp. VK22B]MDX8508707.1 ABC transporter ATP-binding protein [Mesorhizobium sp. VK22E]
MAEAALEIVDASAGYAGRIVLDAIKLSARKGELTAIVGPNGHGKSTLLKAISGLVPVTSGEIRLDGSRIDRLRPDQIVERGVTQVPQGDLLFPAMTVHENLMMGAYANSGGLAERLDFVFTLLPKLKERRNQTAGTLSGGERRMCGIGRGLMAGGEVLMLDEPSLGLAPIVIEQIYEVIFNLRREGRTILLVEENAERIAEHADMIHLLDNGRVAWSGLGAELMARPEIVETYLGV